MGCQRPSIEVISTVNGAPPPPFPNSVYQNVVAGDDLLAYGFYLWDRDGQPMTVADIHMLTATRGLVLDASGRPVGTVRIRAPRGATNTQLTTSGPAVTVPAFITGTPTAMLTVRLAPDPAVPGHYDVTVRFLGGNDVTMHVDAEPRSGG